jgi:hypothetical protein
MYKQDGSYEIEIEKDLTAEELRAAEQDNFPNEGMPFNES